MTHSVVDQAVVLGRRQSLVGVVTQPAGYAPSDRPVLLILNSGIVHRVGHHRMYVTLARLLAGAGYQVLRFDLSGIGDSESRVDDLPPLEGTLLDIREAVDWLVTTRQARRVVLIGLCSGADHALSYGSGDPRVVGLILLDPSIPPTPKYYRLYFLRHLKRPRSWLDLMIGRGRAWNMLRMCLGDTSDEVLEHHRLKLSDPALGSYLRHTYQRSMDLGTQCLAVFTSGFPHQHNYRRQMLDAFPTVPFDGKLRLEYFSDCDHIFTSELNRSRLFDAIMDWMQQTNFVETRAAGPSVKKVSAPVALPLHASHDG